MGGERSPERCSETGAPRAPGGSPQRLAVVLLAAVLFAGVMYALDATRGERLAEPDLSGAAAPAPAPAIRFLDEGGRELGPSDFAGSVVVLNVWATWCAPCRDEMPSLERLQDVLGGPRFQVVAVATDAGGAGTVRRFYERLGIRSLAVYLDHRGDAATRLGALGIPTTLVLGADGRELARVLGPARWSGEATIAALRRHIAATP